MHDCLGIGRGAVVVAFIQRVSTTVLTLRSLTRTLLKPSHSRFPRHKYPFIRSRQRTLSLLLLQLLAFHQSSIKSPTTISRHMSHLTARLKDISLYHFMSRLMICRDLNIASHFAKKEVIFSHTVYCSVGVNRDQFFNNLITWCYLTRKWHTFFVHFLNLNL